MYWVGGGSGAGKSTISRRLARDFTLQRYDTDAAMTGHARDLAPTDAPLLHDFLRKSMDERWLEPTPSEMLESFHWFAGEGFELIVRDLVAMAAHGATVAEGFRLLPRLVAPLLDDRRAAVWLLPTAEFRRQTFEWRASSREIAGRTSDPPRALDNLLARDHLFTQRLRAELDDLGLAAIDVDLGDTDDDVYARVTAALHLPGATARHT
mgnify:CR=1 FL=1